MSWTEEDWTVGLSGRVLQKVKELQIHKERLSRENKQKQLQLDNIHTSLEKQTVKFEEVRGELQSVQRELQSVQEEAKAAITSRERLNQELHTRQAQVCSLEGQLDAARTLNNKLTQEVKRLEAELEKLQNNSRLADATLFSTPCWNTTSPWEHNGSRREERSRQRDEGQNREHHSRQRLQFSDTPAASLQHKSTPHRHPSDQSDTFSTPLAAFPWEQDNSRPASRRQIPASPQMPSPDVINQGPLEKGASGKEKDPKTEASAAPSSELWSRISALEDELSQKVGMLKSIQNEMVQTKKEVASKELSLQRARDELSLAHTRMAQDSERASGAEQKLKQLQEELKCQRQNAESSRMQHQQRTKELEKQHQRDLSELQKERQCLEKQHQQEVNKLNQELQQARTLHNALQAQADKLSLQKQGLDKDLESMKDKLKWTEEQLKEIQKKEAQTQAKLMEGLREAEGVAVSLEQSRKREQALEEEGRRLLKEQADTLRLLKELQAEKSAPAPLQQPGQFCSVGQTFSPHSSFTSPRPPTHSKTRCVTQAEQTREEEGVEERRAEMTSSYPSDREPGEGIDAEHISVITNPESVQRMGQTRRNKEQSQKSSNEAIDSDFPSMSITNFMDGDGPVASKNSTMTQNLMLFGENTSALKSEQTISLEDLKRENALLRSEIHDVRDELQRRLEDLEAQRQAETEARTRLKQLSRKHASQAADREEKDKEWRTKLENEKAETERLRRTVAALEAEMKSCKEEKEEEEEEEQKAQDDRESEMIKLNIQLKNDLAEVKAQLAVEQEERKRDQDERNQIMATDDDIKNELSKKLVEIKAEVESLKDKSKDSQEQKKQFVLNSPLTYLTLHDDELNSNRVSCDTKLLTSPEQHLLFCQSTNQLNTLMSTAAEDIIQEDPKVIGFEHSPLLYDALTPQVFSEDDAKQNYQERFSSSGPERGEHANSDLAKEVEHLQREYAKETERANQYQAKLEALQNQVTRQTQQLTMAFEKQSQHISGLLAELQAKESALFSQGEELLCCKEELEALKMENNKEVKISVRDENKRDQRDEMSAETSEHQLKQEKECIVFFQTTNSLTDGDLNAHHLNIETCDAEIPTSIGSEVKSEALWSGEYHPSSVDSNKSQRYSTDSTCEVTGNQCDQNEGKTDLVTEPLALRQENQLLTQRIEGMTVLVTRNSTLQTDNKNPEDPDKQSKNTSVAALSCLAEQEMQSGTSDVTTVGEELQNNANRSEDEGQDLEREDGKTMSEKDLAEVSEVQVNYLQQQVEVMKRKVRSLYEETQQQAQELAVWRLSSQPAPTFDHFLTNTDEECETLDQISVVCQSLSNQKLTQSQAQTLALKTQVQPLMQGTQKSQDNITVIREDELSLCCSSKKLQGRMLYSRLQSSSLPEAKNIHSFKNTSMLKEPAKDQEASLQWSDSCAAQYKVKRDTEFIQMSTQKMAQQHIAEGPHRSSGPNPTNVVECYTEKPEAIPHPFAETKEINTSDSKDKDATEMKSISSQTEYNLYRHSPPTVCAATQTEEKEENEDKSIDSPSVSPVSLAEKVVSDDKMLFSGSFPIPADPARLAERIRRNRTQLSAAFDDTEYEPYGLPEVVMKGFADIPTGPSCPYIVRRGLLGTAVVPVSQNDPQKEEETD
ncbi:centromere protein F isoform X2 [Melanotaenia boesemani]|uniref:centromere protein F isoform X2 n=1 Tax=Melanotaenia boesemani TaxID=1250792 RepID=UPI001C03B904|nr:centromere protein F isoform X2 [Melanotaenia boesemani]